MADTAYDPELQKLLLSAEYDQAVSRLNSQLSAARNALLFPNQVTGSHSGLADCYQAQQAGSLVAGWQRLKADAELVTQHVTEALRDMSLTGTPRNRSIRRERALQTIAGRRCRLVTRFGAMRAEINQIAMKEYKLSEAKHRNRGITKAFKDAWKSYRKQNQERFASVELRGREIRQEDVHFLNNLRADFSRPREGELGYAALARAVGGWLRHEYYNQQFYLWFNWPWDVLSQPHGFWQRLRGVALVVPRLIAAIIMLPVTLLWGGLLLVLWIMGQLSVRPVVFASTILALIPMFTAAYTLDDLLAPGAISPPAACLTLSFDGLIRAFYFATVNFTSLGPDHPICGRFTNEIVTLESLAGYFLLSVLAAMFFSWLAQR